MTGERLEVVSDTRLAELRDAYEFHVAHPLRDRVVSDRETLSIITELIAIRALSGSPAVAGTEGTEGMAALVAELLSCVHQPTAKEGSNYWHVTAGKHVRFGEIISALRPASPIAPATPEAER